MTVLICIYDRCTSTNVSSSDCLCAVKLFSLTALRGEWLWALHLPALLVSTRLDAMPEM
jgi:hypothetical protein